ncbi:1,4-dihydroxy-2-naphthoate polyprenyltransferase [Candidatus Neomarinimicrobiota bacterium]
MASRPKTLWAAVAPVVVGTAIAARGGQFRPAVAAAIVAAALLIQVGANLANDVYDFLRGADTTGRLGPDRVTQQGLLKPKQVKRGMVFCFGAAITIGFYLAWVGGWPIVAIGLISIGAAIAYVGGPWPFGYYGLGDLMVFLFFGIIAVGGTVYLHTDGFAATSLWGGIPMGAVVTAILIVNNIRDLETDQQTGKLTLAVRLGIKGARLEYVGMMIIAYCVPVVYMLVHGNAEPVLLPLITLPMAWRNVRELYGIDGKALNATLARTAQLTFLYGLLFSLGLVL